MGPFQTVCVMLGLLSFCSANDILDNGDLIHRLESIEATLKLVLEKNENLEKRVDALEVENDLLKTTVADLSEKLQPKDNFDEETETALETHSLKSPSLLPANSISFSNLTKPKQKRQSAIVSSTVAFTAVVSVPSLTNLGAGQTIIYDKIITNVGAAYHSTTGVFTAPNSGVYVFNFAIMIDSNKNQYVELVKNGNPIMFNFGHGAGSTHVSSPSRTATIDLKSGDEVWVRTSTASNHGNGEIHGNSYTTFSGWIIEFTE